MKHRAVEMRIHGVGSHPPSAALGSLSEESEQASPAPGDDSQTREVQTGEAPRTSGGQYLPPMIPVGHDLVLTNWSRTSRSVARFLWYIALPLTLVNVAAHMAPWAPNADSSEIDPILRSKTIGFLRVSGKIVLVLSHVTSGLLSCLFVFWVTAILETIFSFTTQPVNDGSFGSWLPLMASGILTLAVAIRLGLRRNAISWWLAAIHVVIMVGTGWLLHVFRPASNDEVVLSQFWVDLLPEWFIAHTPGSDFNGANGTCYQQMNVGCTPRPDIIMFAVLATCLFATLSVIILLLLHVISRTILRMEKYPRRDALIGAALPGAALLLAMGTVVFSSVASLVRLGIEWLSAYFRSLTFRGLLDNWRPAVAPSERTVLAFYDGASDYGANFISIFAVGALLTTLLIAGLMSLQSVRVERALEEEVQPAYSKKGKRKAVFIHLAVTMLPRRLGLILVIAGIASCAVILVVAGAIYPFSRFTIAAIIILHALVAASMLVIISRGRMASSRLVFGAIADVAGFWPIAVNPLGGASYRDVVVRNVTDYIVATPHESVVVVGHSQGSVIALWAVDTLAASSDSEDSKSVSLVTCGSPIHSLYETFFPRYFNVGQFERVTKKLGNRWQNLWRLTDPIATPIDGVVNIAMSDPESPTGPLRAHSDYWLAAKMITAVNELVSVTTRIAVPEPDAVPAGVNDDSDPNRRWA